VQFTKATSDARKYEEELIHELLLKAQAEPMETPSQQRPWLKPQPAVLEEKPNSDTAAKQNVCPVW
jgi:hypothetical protein